MQEQTVLTMEIYDPFESCMLTGIVLSVDSLGKRVRLLTRWGKAMGECGRHFKCSI